MIATKKVKMEETNLILGNIIILMVLSRVIIQNVYISAVVGNKSRKSIQDGRSTTLS